MWGRARVQRHTATSGLAARIGDRLPIRYLAGAYSRPGTGKKDTIATGTQKGVDVQDHFDVR
jgi:hypothetical protein